MIGESVITKCDTVNTDFKECIADLIGYTETVSGILGIGDTDIDIIGTEKLRKDILDNPPAG